MCFDAFDRSCRVFEAAVGSNGNLQFSETVGPQKEKI